MTNKKKNKKHSAAPAEQKNNTPIPQGPIENPELEAVINSLVEGNSPEKQARLNETLKNARLLSPCDFDVDVQEANGQVLHVQPSQIKFYLLNTNDGSTFFPVFTKIEHVSKMNFGEGVKPKNVVRSLQDFDKLLQEPGNKAKGIIVNPGLNNLVIPMNLIAVLCGRNPAPQPVRPQTTAPLNVTFTEPSVYPTRMVNAIYERSEATKEISRVWLKMKLVGQAASFFIIVESDSKEEHVLNEIREVAVPQAKDVNVEVVFADERIMNTIVKDAVALYDRELGF